MPKQLLVRRTLRAEFDRSKAENKAIEASRQEYIKILDETMLENEELQSHLDTICEPIKREYPTMRSLSLEEVKAEEKVMLEVYRLVWAYLDLQKEKPDSFKFNISYDWHDIPDGDKWITHTGKSEDCPTCNPPITQCPECIWGQIKVPYYYNHKGKATRLSSQSLRLAFEVYERCPRCRGEGRIPC